MTARGHVAFLWGRACDLAVGLAVELGLDLPGSHAATLTPGHRAAALAGDVRMAVTRRLLDGQVVSQGVLARLDELDRLLIKCRERQLALSREVAHA